MGLQAGTIINGKYRVVRQLDARGIGALYECRNVRGDARVAVKVMRREFAANQEWATRFEREASAAARIGSPRIARVLEVGELPNRCKFVVTEFLDGEKLSTRIEREARLPPAVMADLAAQLLEALERVHAAGVVHRDIKPANVFLQKMGGADYVCLLDFGVCKDLADHYRYAVSTGIGQLLGAVAYSAPECIERGSSRSDPRSDIFSVGMVMYSGIAGVHPFRSRDPGELIAKIRSGPPVPLAQATPDVDPILSGIVQRALAYAQASRFQSATEMKDALHAWLAASRAARHHDLERESERTPAPSSVRSTVRMNAGAMRHMLHSAPTVEVEIGEADRDASIDVPIDVEEMEAEEDPITIQRKVNPVRSTARLKDPRRR